MRVGVFAAANYLKMARRIRRSDRRLSILPIGGKKLLFASSKGQIYLLLLSIYSCAPECVGLAGDEAKRVCLRASQKLENSGICGQ
jgi:hypothetical protein